MHILNQKQGGVKMAHEKMQALTGAPNKRLNSTMPTHDESTAAWCDTKKTLKDSHVRIPSEKGVLNAKEWVDNGSKL